MSEKKLGVNRALIALATGYWSSDDWT